MDLQHILTIVTVVFASTGFWTFLNSYIERKTRKRSDLEEGVLALLHDRIYELAKAYLAKCSISDGDHKNLDVMYKVYHKMGGNGTAEKLVRDVDKLPIKED